MSLSLIETPLPELIVALRERRIAAVQLWEEAADRHRRYGAALNAYKLWLPELAEAQARAADAAFAVDADLGPAQGVPVSIKDVFGLKGTPTYAGTAKPLPARYESEGPIVGGLRRQLAVFPGKAHTVPFAFGAIGTNAHWGAPRNPWDQHHHRGSGASSSGAGVSLWEGSAVLALGSDAGGSIRMPASLTGTVGLKTSIGRWSGAGAPPLSPTLDTPGILARSVADAIVGFAAIDPKGYRWTELWQSLSGRPLSGLRLGIGDRFFFDECGPGIAEAVRAALRELEAAGARLEDRPMPEAKEAYAYMASGSVGVPEGFALVSSEFKEWIPDLDANVWARLKNYGDISAAEYLARKRQMAPMSEAAHRRLAGIDVLATPTTASTAPRLDEVEDMEAFRLRTLKIGRNVGVFNVWNMCAINIPVGLDPDGMPIGMQLVAPRNEEERLLAIALAVERVLGTPRQRLGRPPMCP
ncbi:MAG: amidase [Proteobacteria bacterium]|nr:amidase [Pseudomonadota bacterium]